MKCKGLVFGLLTLSSLFALPKAQAKQDPEYWRWFEVEVLVFKQRIADASSE